MQFIVSILITVVFAANASAFWGGVTAPQLQSDKNGLGADMVPGAVKRVATVAALKASSPAYGQTVYLEGRVSENDGGQGLFQFLSGNYSPQITVDNLGGVYIAPNSAPSGASGAWVRQYSGAISPRWFGASPALADNSVYFSEAFEIGGAGATVYVDAFYSITAPIQASAINQSLFGDSWGHGLNQTSVAAGKHGVETAYDGFSVMGIRFQSPTQIGNENIAVKATKGDSSAITDIKIEHCFITGFSYAASITNATRPVISQNYIYSTGDNSTDTGGAIQISQVIDGQITDNIISGDSANKFQHGIYAAGDVSGLRIEGNIIRNGFYSYGIHIYGATFVNGRENITIKGNIISGMPGGILIAASAGNIGGAENVVISDNKISVTNRGLYFAGSVFENIEITRNSVISSGASASDYIFELSQIAGNITKNFVVAQNVFKDFKNGGLDFNNAQNMSSIKINHNVFSAYAASHVALTLDAAPGNYTNIEIVGNSYAGDYPVTVSSTNYSGWKNSIQFTMQGNSWDTNEWSKVTQVSTTPYTVVSADASIWVTGGAGGVTVNLPAITTELDGRIITICKIDSGAGAVTIDPDSTQLINGAATYVLSARWQTVSIMAVRGGAWIIVGKN